MKYHLIVNRVFIAAAVGIAGLSSLMAQSYLGGVRGLVQDPGGAVIASAKVTLANEATTVSRATVTNAQG